METERMERRLQKALIVAEKLKRKELFEQEVNKELAKRNELLKKQLAQAEARCHEMSRAISKLDEQLEGIFQCKEQEMDQLHAYVKRFTSFKEEWDQFKYGLHRKSTYFTPDNDNASGQEEVTPVRPRSRKRSSLFIKVPELMGTSLLRRSVDQSNTPALLSSREESQLGQSLKGIFRPLSPFNRSQFAHNANHSSSLLSDSPIASPDISVHVATAVTEPCSLNDVQQAVPMVTPAAFDSPAECRATVPLFEHFIVVGASVEAAQEFSSQLQAFDNDSLSNRLKKTLGGFLNSPIIMGSGRSNGSLQQQDTPKRLGAAIAAISVDPGDISPSNQAMTIVGERARTKSMESVVDEIGQVAQVAPVPVSRSLLSMFSSRSVSAKPAIHRTISNDTNDESVHNLSHSNQLAGSSNQTDFQTFVDMVEEQDLSLLGSNEDHKEGKASSIVSSNAFVEEPTSAGGKGMSDMVMNTSTALSRFGGAMFSKLSKATTATISASASDSIHGHSANAVAHAPSDQQSLSTHDTLATAAPQSLHSLGELSLALPGPDSNSKENLLQHMHSSFSSSSTNTAPNIPYLQASDDPKHIHSSGIASSKAELLHVDKRNGIATASTQIIYHYPPDVDLPPKEVCDFCLPLGCKLQKLASAKDEDSLVKDILFGHTHSKRSERCYIFLLEDKTLEIEEADEETGVGVSKLYAVCVALPRLLHTSDQSMPANANGNSAGTDFESVVCYAFLTRFPLFELFFQLIFDLVSCERLMRMESVSNSPDPDFRLSKQCYEYIPREMLDNALSRLTLLSPPKYNQSIRFTLYPGIQPIEHHRAMPSLCDLPEYSLRAADWCLPPFLLHLPPELIVWTLSLLLGEVKVLVVGQEVGMVSCAIMSLLLLLRPLEWVSPVIPLLPMGMMDFIESPVPILTGIVLDSSANDSKGIDIHRILHMACLEDAIMTAVLDVSAKALYIPHSYSSSIHSLPLPDADMLTSRLHAYVPSSATNANFANPIGLGTPSHMSNSSSNGSFASSAIKSTVHKGCYALSAFQRDAAKCMHEVLCSHLQAIANLAVESQRVALCSAHAHMDVMSGGEKCNSSLPGADDMRNAPVETDLLDFSPDIYQHPATSISATADAPSTPSAAEDEANDDSPPNTASLLDLYAKIISDKEDDNSSSVSIPANPASTAPSALQKTVSMFSYGNTQSAHSALSQQLVSLQRDHFFEADEDAFMAKFVCTQIFSEYFASMSARPEAACSMK